VLDLAYSPVHTPALLNVCTFLSLYLGSRIIHVHARQLPRIYNVFHDRQNVHGSGCAREMQGK
jgi:hypothetical protein